MTPEQRLERVRMALAEAGYPSEDYPVGIYQLAVCDYSFAIPLYVFWRAKALAGCQPWCWPCRRRAETEVSLNPDHPTYFLEPCGHFIDPFCREDAEVSSC